MSEVCLKISSFQRGLHSCFFTAASPCAVVHACDRTVVSPMCSRVDRIQHSHSCFYISPSSRESACLLAVDRFLCRIYSTCSLVVSIVNIIFYRSSGCVHGITVIDRSCSCRGRMTVFKQLEHTALLKGERMPSHN